MISFIPLKLEYMWYFLILILKQAFRVFMLWNSPKIDETIFLLWELGVATLIIKITPCKRIYIFAIVTYSYVYIFCFLVRFILLTTPAVVFHQIHRHQLDHPHLSQVGFCFIDYLITWMGQATWKYLKFVFSTKSNKNSWKKFRFGEIM